MSSTPDKQNTNGKFKDLAFFLFFRQHFFSLIPPRPPEGWKALKAGGCHLIKRRTMPKHRQRLFVAYRKLCINWQSPRMYVDLHNRFVFNNQLITMKYYTFIVHRYSIDRIVSGSALDTVAAGRFCPRERAPFRSEFRQAFKSHILI